MELEDRQVWMGFIEWEDDGSLLIRSEVGSHLPPEIEQDIVKFIDRAKRKIQ